MYEIIINGRDDDKYDQTSRDIDYSLEDERWWQDIKRLRQPYNMSASQELAQTVDILEAVTNWPIASFQHSRRESKPRRFAALQKLLRRAKNRSSAGDMLDSSTRNQQLPVDLLLESDSDANQSSLSEDGRDDDADDEAMVSESEAAVSGSNFDEYDLDASSDEGESRSGQKRPPRRTQTTTGSSFFSKRLDLRKAIWKGSPKDSSFNDDRSTSRSVTPLKPHFGAVASDTAIPRARKSKQPRSAASSVSQLSTSSRVRSSIKPPSMQHGSLPKFTSNPTPRTAVASDEVSGPSIMFVDTPSPAVAKKKDPMATTTPGSSRRSAAGPSSHTSTTANSPRSSATALPSDLPASGFPSQQAIPLSFNDLPCRAQHLILNELLRQQSDDAAVVFTTLPSPMEGTCESEAESVKYISDLEVLCQGLPPVLLVHSNSMTVTMNL